MTTQVLSIWIPPTIALTTVRGKGDCSRLQNVVEENVTRMDVGVIASKLEWVIATDTAPRNTIYIVIRVSLY